MNRRGRGTRHPDSWASAHERARTRAAQRLDWPLDPAEAAWLEAHLAECTSCRAVAEEYLGNRDRLRKLRDVAPLPPRDLWARTAAAIEHEARRGRGPAVRTVPLGALSGVLVIAVVLGATLLSNAPRPPVVNPSASGPLTAASAEPSIVVGPAGTPLIITAGDVRYVGRDEDGTLGFRRLGVERVCPKKTDADCPMVQDQYTTALGIEAEPQTIIGSPADDQAVVVSKPDDSKASTIIVLALPEGSPPSETPAPPSDEPTATASATPEVSEPPTTESAPPSDEPTESVTPVESQVPSAEPATPTPTPEVTAEVTPSPTPESIAIASGLIVVGQTAAYSPDGSWFAFTARPADEGHGPDIYLWRVGSDEAVPATTDHRSVFASWAGSELVGSRPAEAQADGIEVEAAAFLLDPETGDETALAVPGWRPIVAPDGERALVFNGTVSATDDGHDIARSDGTLELRGWDAADGAIAEDAEVVLDAVGSPIDARWDETGTAFAVWVQDPADPSFGRLSLFFVDPETGAVEQPETAPRDEPALPGFSIGEGRLAWATPAGQGGEGSRVQIVAWSDDGVGTAESAPGDQVVVIR